MMRTGTIDPSQSAFFWRQVSSLLRSGLTLPDALAALGRDAEAAGLRDAIRGIEIAVKSGEPLGEAFRRGPFVSDPAVIACIEAGERSGDLPGAAAILAAYGERTELLRLRGRMVLTYPIILLVVALASFWSFSTWILPVYGALFANLGNGASLPLVTRLAVFLTRLFVVAAPPAALALAAAALAYRQPMKFPGLRRKVDHVLLRIPVWSRYYRSLILARFSRTFALLLRSSVPLHEALATAGRAGGNSMLEEEAKAASLEVQEGGRAGASFKPGAALPGAMVWAFKLSEERGDLEETMEALADYYDEAAAIGASTFLTTIEPLSIAALGLIVAIGIVGMVLPMFRLIGSLGF